MTCWAVTAALDWLKATFLYVRVKRKPAAYGTLSVGLIFIRFNQQPSGISEAVGGDKLDAHLQGDIAVVGNCWVTSARSVLNRHVHGWRQQAGRR